ncbi:MAG: type II secretion system protein, partial [Myxococcales bacterium]
MRGSIDSVWFAPRGDQPMPTISIPMAPTVNPVVSIGSSDPPGMPLQTDRLNVMMMRSLRSAPLARSARRAAGSARRAVVRGVTLIEVLIVVAILSMISAGVVVAVLPKMKDASIKTTENNAREIRSAIQRWRGLRGGTDCPTISQLVQDKEIDSASKTEDAWNSPFKIACSEDDVVVSSPGPDKKDNTADDILVPKGVAVRLGLPCPTSPPPACDRRPAPGRS